ncbi:hypothetical protein QNH28_25135 [Paenibacillus sp. G2S3]|uniref:hypothetical protein n=1 Tax=Paenibacillus sp. G2S3 TaxID=3047872 RepID=UPI0024C13698|nr:hypothetical protein [Paenibacillus sp. G2S3]WHY18706.1 hypothetical protein QNH28_25135 [Paenibacillus sp. G2S3]
MPEQLKIIGYDYHSFTRMLQSPKLTTIMQPSDLIGVMPTNTLLQMIESADGELIAILLNLSIKKADYRFLVACLFVMVTFISTLTVIIVTTSASQNMLIGQVPNF